MRRNIKFSHFLISISFVFFYCADILADGSPVVQDMAAKGDYLLISENGGLYTIHKNKDRFDWKLDHGHSQIIETPDGKIWDNYCTFSYGIPNKLRRFDGKKWIEYEYPKIKGGYDIRSYFSNEKTYLVIENFDNSVHALYVSDDNSWKKLTDFPADDYLISTVFVIGDTITVTAKDQNYYSYSITLNEWKKTKTYEERNAFYASLPPSSSDTFGRGYKIEFEGNSVTAIVSPEGSRFIPGSNSHLASPYFTPDNEGYYYIQTYNIPDSNENKLITQLWSDRSGEWKVIATGNRELSYISTSDDPDRAIWGSDGRTYLAFLHEGQWLEIALLPPELDCSCGDEGGHMHPMRERYPEAEDMKLGIINDPDGYVNVRNQPGAWVPVVAIILKDVEFLFKSIDNSQWSKVLLPSGTTGYISNDRIRQLD